MIPKNIFKQIMNYRTAMSKAQDDIDAGVRTNDKKLRTLYYLSARKTYSKYLNDNTFKERYVREKIADLERQLR